MSQQERKERRQRLLAAVKQATIERVRQAVRPQDEDDQEASEALIEALLAGRHGGYTPAEVQAIKGLAQDWIEARENTP